MLNMLFKSMFVCLDVNGDDIIDINEWTMHNAAMGIPPGYAQDSFNAMDKDGMRRKQWMNLSIIMPNFFSPPRIN